MQRSVGDHAHQHEVEEASGHPYRSGTEDSDGNPPPSRAARRSRADPLAGLFPASASRAGAQDAASVVDPDARLAALFAASGTADAEPSTPYVDSGMYSRGASPSAGAKRRTGMWWTIAAAVVVGGGLVLAAVFAVPLFAENARLADARTIYVSAATSAASADAAWDSALATYTHTADTARADAASVEPALAALQGMSDQTILDAANTARVALIAALDQSAVPTSPEAYVERDADEITDPAELAAATSDARDHAARVGAARTELREVQASVVSLDTAFGEALRALGSSLPGAVGGIIDQNSSADQASKDTVIAAADAVVAAQETGLLGDAEMLAYANAVIALRQAATVAAG